MKSFIATTFKIYLNEHINSFADKIRLVYTNEKNNDINELEFSKLIKIGLKYDENFMKYLTNAEKNIWLELQDLDFNENIINLPIIKIPIDEIYFSQIDVNINKIEKNNHHKGIPIFIKKNNKFYIISGNHRLFNQLIIQHKDEILGYIKNFDIKK
jgi:hypothetical protein